MMTVASLVLALLLANVQLSCSCDGEGQILICTSLPTYFSPGFSTLMMYLRDFGEINSTVFRSSNLTSVTKLWINGAGVTAIAEGAFGSFQNLTSLSLNYNALTRVNSGWLTRPAALSVLSLTGNQIQAVTTSMFSGFVGLTKLSLNSNNIRTLSPSSFSSQTNLTELDLSDNKLTRISPQVFSSFSFGSRIRLHRNPWDCTCEAQESVASLKDLWSRSLLDPQTGVTCDAPPHLEGKPVWNVSVCSPPPTLGPASVTPPVHPKPTDAFHTDPAASASSTRTSETKTSVGPKPTDIGPTSSLKTVSAPSTPPVETETSVQPRPSDVPLTVSPQTEPPSHTICTLVVVIAILCVLLFVPCVLATLHWRKRKNKTVKPSCPNEGRNEFEEGSVSGSNQLPGNPGGSDPERAWKWPVRGSRAKSANAVLLSSSFCSSAKHQAGLGQVTKNLANPEEKKEPVNKSETEATPEESLSKSEIVKTNEKRADAGGDTEQPHPGFVHTETVPYLSIGTNPGDANNRDQFRPGQRSQVGKVLGRICTWPPTASQWQERCRMKEEEEKVERSEVVSVWTQNQMLSSEKKNLNPGEQRYEGTRRIMAERREKDPEDVKIAPTMNPSMKKEGSMRLKLKEDDIIQDAATRKEPRSEAQNTGFQPEVDPTCKTLRKGRNKSVRSQREPEGAAPSGQRLENRSSGSKAPSGGTSPDDDTLLSGNQYAFMDLLHEVVQNNGRWTRERWKQIHVNKQRR